MITTDAYLLGACRYVVQNPVRAGICATCEDWRWSSYRATIGAAPARPFLAAQAVLDFVAPQSRDQVAAFRDFCAVVVPKRQRLDGHAVAATRTAV